ncbi:hypothetical protein BLA29_003910 [Euroglyphus maynei]|uniref:DFP2-like protein n=1 Tax=Euroglyphus maynei TaxID=6958 RepID=A0A1Y3BVA9_EURMA|nr:hypothetical protein BLA29_003910 [Euroglyphus maynei]
MAYQYDDYQAYELKSAPQPEPSYAETSNGYAQRGYNRQSQTNDGYSSQSVYSQVGNNAYTASIRGSQRNVKVIDIPSTYSLPAETMTIQIPPSSQPLTFILKSRSSQLNLQSSHQSDPGSYKETNSEDGLHVLVHTVTRPVLQEIREIITPYRRVTQEIKPVQETAETLVAQDKRGYNQNGQSSPAKPKQQQQQPTVLAQKPLKLAPPKPQQQNYKQPQPSQSQQQNYKQPQPSQSQQQNYKQPQPSQSQQQNYKQIQPKSMKPAPKQQPNNRPAPLAPVAAAAQKPKTY